MSGHTDLLDCIDWSCLECLNQQASHPVTNALKQGYREDDGLVLESDTDEQLLIHIPFNQTVKLHSLCIKSSGTEGQAPMRVKLFVNKATLGFSEATDIPSTQEFELSEEQLKGDPIMLKYVKFQSVVNLTIFIEDNQGDEETTKIQKITLIGSPGQSMNVNDIKSVEEMAKQEQG